MKTSELFNKELDYISDDTLREIVAETLDMSPECIAHIPASSSGRYHPIYSLGEGGLMRHIKAAVGIAHSMIETDIFKNITIGIDAYDDNTLVIYKDCAYAALILHDCMKPDDSEKHSTRFDHPLLAAKLFKEVAVNYIIKDNMEYMKIVVPLVYKCIASHMGQWATAPYARGIKLPTPHNGLSEFVHMCDYLASRKFLIFDFDKYDYNSRG